MADILMITLHKINIKQHSHITQKVDSCTRCCPRHSPRRCRRRCGCHCDDLLEGQRVFAAQLHACSALASSSSSSSGGNTTRLYDLQKAFNCNCTEGRYITRHTDAFHGVRPSLEFGESKIKVTRHTSHVTGHLLMMSKMISGCTREETQRWDSKRHAFDEA